LDIGARPVIADKIVFRILGFDAVIAVFDRKHREGAPGIRGGVKGKKDLGAFPPLIDQYHPELSLGQGFAFPHGYAVASYPDFFVKFIADPIIRAETPNQALKIMVQIQFIQIVYTVVILRKDKKGKPRIGPPASPIVHQPYGAVGNLRFGSGTGKAAEDEAKP
jgi:hypothetical protein